MLCQRQVAISARSFSTSACLQRHVSHIGSLRINYPSAVTLTPTSTDITISGPLGATTLPLRPYMKIVFPRESCMTLHVDDAEVLEQRQMWGTTRTLIYNSIIGVSEGFTVPLHLVGVGYRAVLEDDPRREITKSNGQRLNLKIGYTHSVYVPIPPHIKCTVPFPTKIVLFCTDKQRLGQFAAEIRNKRKPEPYKGKGIFIGNETIKIKKSKRK
ncbi:ribosomal protein L6 [Fistulina hepatica ATCC 64428]|uniref:Ribosomal protein L6 n=1 Tax=Fistulina hepatica ATCC 64428 TaxID=1128425 RepID=A0A0D7ADZ3_9AGAR|nr:ribosomal protein L6 [Fistulina hepatica ATCC 64428]